ncbi:unnamed protein product [Phaeothamnion confervicola]
MGPKKAAGKKGKKDDAGQEEGMPLSDVDRARMAEAALTSLKMQLADRTDEANQALAERQRMQDRVEDMQRMLKEAGQGTFVITQDMTRQYKGMQEELLNRINQLERTIAVLQDELEASRADTQRVAREKDAVIEAKDRDLQQARMRVRMDAVVQEFGDMLKETLDTMRERIEVNSVGFEADDALPLQRKMDDLSLGDVPLYK